MEDFKTAEEILQKEFYGEFNITVPNTRMVRCAMRAMNVYARQTVRFVLAVASEKAMIHYPSGQYLIPSVDPGSITSLEQEILYVLGIEKFTYLRQMTFPITYQNQRIEVMTMPDGSYLLFTPGDRPIWIYKKEGYQGSLKIWESNEIDSHRATEIGSLIDEHLSKNPF